MPTELFAPETRVLRTLQGIEDTSPERLSRSTNKRNLINRMREQNPRLTTGLSAVHTRFITGKRSALCCWLLTSGPTPCLCKPFSCKACPGTTAFLETSPFAMLLLLWCLAFVWALKDLSPLLVYSTAYLYSRICLA